MSKLSDLINAEDSFLVKLRCENIFDESKYLEIKNQIAIEIPVWKTQGFVLNCDFLLCCFYIIAISRVCQRRNMPQERSRKSFWGERQQENRETACNQKNCVFSFSNYSSYQKKIHTLKELKNLFGDGKKTNPLVFHTYM